MNSGTELTNFDDIKLNADILQELEERVSTGTGRDKTHSKCTLGYWAIYGGHRSEVI